MSKLSAISAQTRNLAPKTTHVKPLLTACCFVLNEKQHFMRPPGPRLDEMQMLSKLSVSLSEALPVFKNISFKREWFHFSIPKTKSYHKTQTRRTFCFVFKHFAFAMDAFVCFRQRCRPSHMMHNFLSVLGCTVWKLVFDSTHRYMA